MYLFFSRISKLSARRGNSRFLSSLTLSLHSLPLMLRKSPPASSLYRLSEEDVTRSLKDLTRWDISGSLPQSPYLWEGTKIIHDTRDAKIVRQSYYDPTKEKTLLSEEHKYPHVPSLCQPVGASHGWVFKTDGEMAYLTDIYKPWVSSPRVILLPPLHLHATWFTKSKAVSLSSSDPVQDDNNVFVATTFDDFHLSVCRLCDSEWTHIKLPKSILPVSTLTYSKRDKAFYLTSLKGRYLRLLDLSDNKIKCRSLHLRNIPKISAAGRKELLECILTQHLVESPSGELIFIRWYTECIVEEFTVDNVEIYPIKPKRFMVFREDEKSKNFCYTEDIGDLCIFLGDSESFCVSASMYPGLTPNSIYYAFGSGQTAHSMYYENGPLIGRYSLDSAKTYPLVLQGLLYDVFHGTHWISPS